MQQVINLTLFDCSIVLGWWCISKASDWKNRTKQNTINAQALTQRLFVPLNFCTDVLSMFLGWWVGLFGRWLLVFLLSCFSLIQLFATRWTVACQTPLPRGFPGKNSGAGCHILLQGIFPTQGSNTHLLHCKAYSLLLSHRDSPSKMLSYLLQLNELNSLYEGMCVRNFIFYSALKNY